jgi:OmpA-OmpF porin, OOP family
MNTNRASFARLLALAFVVVLSGAALAQAQDASATEQSRVRQVASGQKTKIRGVIVVRDPDSITVRDTTNTDTVVALTDTTSVKSNGGFLRAGTNYDVTNLLRGLIVEVEGTGNTSGQLIAKKIRFDKQDLKTATALESRVSPVEDRVSTVERESKALAGQVDELSELSKLAKDEADKANAEAARANAGVEATNVRISNLDNFDVKTQVSVLFKVNSAVLTPEAMADLDKLAEDASNQQGYILEVAGFTDTTGSMAKNLALSQRRADAVVQYLAGVRSIPLRRIVTPAGYGALKPVADNTTRDGRMQNRRVEVNLLVNKGLMTETASSTP